MALWLQKGILRPPLTSAQTLYTRGIQMRPSTPPSRTSGSGVTLICQEAEGEQIYNDSREQHQVTTVNIYTGLTKDVAKVRGGSKHCRNYNQPQIINQMKNQAVRLRGWIFHCSVMIATTTKKSDVLMNASCCVRLYVFNINGVLIMIPDI